MKLRHLTAATTAVVLAGTAVAATTPAQAAQKPGTQSLASVLAADGHGFDSNPRDFDVLDNAVRAVLKAKPHSPVKVLADGRVRLTAFAPTDGAFRRLAEDLTGRQISSERRVFTALVNAAGVNTVEAVLEYHVVPGKTITYKQARAADGARLTTALTGKTLTVRVHDGRVVLVDADRNDKNARAIPGLADINKGNRQIAHGISEVLRPTDLT